MPVPRSKQKTVISASRRTDIPAFYMDWFMDGLFRGFFDVENPYSRKNHRVAVTPENTHTIVFWSKNFGPFLRGSCCERILDMGHRLFFNFTVNSSHPILEPHVPSLSERLTQMNALCRNIDARALVWRFDPICHFTDASGHVNDTFSDFKHIARHASDAGIRRCITSFADLYPKVLARKATGLRLIDIPMADKVEIILSMEDFLAPLGIRLFVCCEHALLDSLPAASTVEKAACIPADVLIRLYGPGISRARDQGQRKAKGCGCNVSRDIGSYRTQPCFHNCLFCYANPKPPGGFCHA